MAAVATDPFDALYRRDADPWGTHVRWYEHRKRALLIAALPQQRYGSAYEAGCGTGHLSVALATHCDRLLASDGSAEAVELARSATKELPNVEVVRHRLPDEWPAARFDLVVLGELLYFLDNDARTRTAVAARASAGDGGLVVACDWIHFIEGRGLTGDEAHRAFADALALPTVFEYRDDDFVLTGWSADRRSVAQREGLR